MTVSSEMTLFVTVEIWTLIQQHTMCRSKNSIWSFKHGQNLLFETSYLAFEIAFSHHSKGVVFHNCLWAAKSGFLWYICAISVDPILLLRCANKEHSKSGSGPIFKWRQMGGCCWTESFIHMTKTGHWWYYHIGGREKICAIFKGNTIFFFYMVGKRK